MNHPDLLVDLDELSELDTETLLPEEIQQISSEYLAKAQLCIELAEMPENSRYEQLLSANSIGYSVVAELLGETSLTNSYRELGTALEKTQFDARTATGTIVTICFALLVGIWIGTLL